MLILLSGFCLFMPYAKSMVYGTEALCAKVFYKKRVTRIFPSYYFSIFLILFLFVLPLGEYADRRFLWKDLLSYIFFVNNFSYDTLIGTRLNGVLWPVDPPCKILCDHHMSFPNGQQWQVIYRYVLSLVCLLILFRTLMAQPYFHFLLGNRFMKFPADISFNLYIWHQHIAVKLKEFRIPYRKGDTQPNQIARLILRRYDKSKY